MDMHIVVALLIVIALAVIGGPVVGGIALFGTALLLVPGFGLFLGVAAFLIALLVVFGVLSIKVLLGVVFVLAFALLLFDRAKVAAKQSQLLDRKPIEGTDLYQDQYGQRWRKVAGIFKAVDAQKVPE
jgi:hypothetical protein